MCGGFAVLKRQRLCGLVALGMGKRYLEALGTGQVVLGMSFAAVVALGTLASVLAHSWSGGGAAAMHVHSSAVHWDGTRVHFCRFWQAEPLGSLA